MRHTSQPTRSLLLSLAAIAVAAVALALSLGDGARSAPAVDARGAGSDAELEQQVRALAEKLDRIEAAVARRDAAAARAETAESRRAEIAAVVAAVLDARADGADGALAVADAPELNVDDAVARLVEQGVGSDRAQALWQEIRDAKRVDDVVAAFERRAQENPNSADAQAELGSAYIQQIMETDNYMEQGLVAMKADAAFDAALALDSTHWNARFSKAVSYTFWPDFLGKKSEAIDNLRTLADQQEAGPTKPMHAQTYLILGNLLQQRGDADEARKVWERGLALHPDQAELRKRLGR